MRTPATLLAITTTLLLAACGGGGGGASTSEAQAPAPVLAAPAKLTTLVGDVDSAGLHWILVGDGFTAAQQDDLRETALEIAQALLDRPELAGHTDVWNVHLLQTDSPESGVDNPAQSHWVNTTFDGQLGCGSNSRVACVNWEKVQATLAAQGAPAAQITMILNTTDYVGSSGVSGIIVSRNANAPLITLHEMGHRVAGLADEYVDSVVANELMPYYVEGRFPNVTRQTDTTQVPWKHWLSANPAEVGLFEGAYYAAHGFYRPKHDSFMRTLTAPIGEVNAEAWVRAQYRALPPLSGATPAVGPVRALAGDAVQFFADSPWPREAVTLRWFVDGEESFAARDLEYFTLSADGGDHEVQLVARDAGEFVRAPGASESEVRYTWWVSPNAKPGTQKAAHAGTAVEWLRLRVDGAGHTLLAREPARRGTVISEPADGDWRYELLAEDGRTLASGLVADPRRVRTALPLEGGGHGFAMLESGIYEVAMPAGESPRKIRIGATAAGRAKLGWTGSLAAVEILLEPR